MTPLLLFALIFFIIVIAVIVVVSMMKGKSEDRVIGKDREALLKDANKRLSSNPKDPKALMTLAEIYYNDREYKKAMKTYHVLLDLCGMNPDLDEIMINLRYGLSAMASEVYSEAYKSLLIARQQRPDLFEVNANLGKLEYMRKNYEKAVSFLQRALQVQPDHSNSFKYMGQSLYKLKRFKEGLGYLKQTVAASPDDKESLFALARCHYELGQSDLAVKIFTHLRPDPVWGPHAALYSGTIHSKKASYEQAAMDFEIGLKHENIQQELKLELQYRLAQTFNQNNNIPRALELLKEIKRVNSDYKDVSSMVSKLSELNSNQNLQVYLMAPVSEFISLCRRVITIIFPNVKVKVADITVQKSEYVDILADIKAQKWEDVILFRFIRSEGKVGELFIRDLYARTKEVHAGRGFCITAGLFTPDSAKFVEARLIDLIEKQELLKLLRQVSNF